MRLKLTKEPKEGFLVHCISEFPNGEPMPIGIETVVRGKFLLSDTSLYVLRVDENSGTQQRVCKASSVKSFSDRIAGIPTN